MALSTPESLNPPEESGLDVHQRETRYHIWLPFLGGILLVVIVFLVMALPADAGARIRAAAVADWTVSILCIIPIVLVCLLPLYLVTIIGVWGMNRLHGMAEAPLHRVEIATDGLADRIETMMLTWDERMINWRTKLEPFLYYLRIFDKKPVDIDEEIDNNA